METENPCRNELHQNENELKSVKMKRKNLLVVRRLESDYRS